MLMVVDGQGGGIGRAIIKRFRDVFKESVEIIALGTNSVATAQMMKAGANRGATGENAIVKMVSEVDIIVGPLAIILADSMMGEVTPGISRAISSCRAQKVLIPLTREKVEIVGVSNEPLPHLIDKAIELIRKGVRDV